MGIEYNEIIEHLEEQEIKNKGVKVIFTECPNCGRETRRTVRRNGIKQSNHFCRNYTRCSTEYYPILENITAIYEKKKVIK